MQKKRKSTTKKSIPDTRKSPAEDQKSTAKDINRSWDVLGSLVTAKARESKCGFNQYLYRYIHYVQSFLEKRERGISPLEFYLTGMDVNEFKEAPSLDVNKCAEAITGDPDVKMEDDTPSNPPDGEFVKRGRGRPRKDSLRNERMTPGSLITSYLTTQAPSNV